MMVISVSTTGTLAQAIKDYLGHDELKDLEVVPDPGVPGTFALRATLSDRTLDFLVSGVGLDKVRAADLEECEFTKWPPTRGTHPTTFNLHY